MLTILFCMSFIGLISGGILCELGQEKMGDSLIRWGFRFYFLWAVGIIVTVCSLVGGLFL